MAGRRERQKIAGRGRCRRRTGRRARCSLWFLPSAPRRRIDLRISATRRSGWKIPSPSNAISLRGRARHRKLVERHVERHVIVQQHQLARDPRLLGFSSSASRRFGCLISPARLSSVSRSPYSTINCAAVLMPMPGTPGTLSVESPPAPAPRRPFPAARRIFRSLRQCRCGDPSWCRTSSPCRDELHQVLVGGDDGRGGARSPASRA